jgi:2-polyprenyl-3-methyl-5-hydroxy-6-metoxy-1,4-benzoquinol methylase
MSRKTFSDKEIRPPEFDKGKFEARQRDINLLISQKDEFIEVPCPACTSSNAEFTFEKYSFIFKRCNMCRTVFMSPRATPFILKKFYETSALYDYWNKFIYPASLEARRKRIFKPRLKRIINICNKYQIPANTIVEIGAGFGMFCEEAIESGKFKRVIGVELNNQLEDTCRGKGIEVYHSFEQLEAKEIKADVIVCFEVIEHVFSPYDFITDCKRILKNNALLILTCPNYEGFDISTLVEKSDNVDAEHINLFNPKSLCTLLNICNFCVLELSTPGELDAEIVRNKALTGELDLQFQPFLRTVLLERWEELGSRFQEFLRKNNLSSHLWIAGKINN